MIRESLKKAHAALRRGDDRSARAYYLEVAEECKDYELKEYFSKLAVPNSQQGNHVACSNSHGGANR